jgi:hypothetical protein
LACLALAVSQAPFLTGEEVSARYRGEISVGTLRNWRAMRIGPAYVKIGKAVLYPVEELEAWDRKNLVNCRTSKALGHDARTTPAIGAASPTG